MCAKFYGLISVAVFGTAAIRVQHPDVALGAFWIGGASGKHYAVTREQKLESALMGYLLDSGDPKM